MVLIDGGWRWRLLSLGSHCAFGFGRPWSALLVFDRSDADADADRVWNGRAIAGAPTLSDTIAHEAAQVLIARRYGELRAPLRQASGAADAAVEGGRMRRPYVGREQPVRCGRGTATAEHPRAVPLAYYNARRQVTATLARSGGRVETVPGKE